MPARGSPLRFRAGFTLIELLVVVAIVALLAAILFPVFSRAKEASKATACASNIRQMQTGVQLYLADSDDRYPLGAYVAGAGFVLWHDIIDPYIRNKEVWLCPSSSLGKTEADGSPTSHFGYNVRYLTTLEYGFSNADGHTAVAATSLGSPSETVAFATAKSSVEGSWCGDDGKFLLPPSGPSADCWGRPDPNAALHATIAWADTHVSRRRLPAFYEGQSPPDRFFDLE
jgi:prepilin-type N-terminal cleavage/methylation domain-containing protein